MRVLIACEYSGAVRDQFIAGGHEAMSFDLLPTDAPGPHYEDDVRDVLDYPWDLMIAHPPCTHLSISGARHFETKRSDGRQQSAVSFFMMLAKADIPTIGIENPVCIMSSMWRRPDQIIQPWQFGHGETKATCLWLKGLPLLRATNIVDGREQHIHRMVPMPTNDLVDRVIGSKDTVADAIAVFRRDDIPGRKWAPKTAEVYESVIRRIEAGFGARPVEEVTVKDCAEFIRAVTPSGRARQQFRLVLGWILGCAVQEGWIDTNPVLATRRVQHERKRTRLTKEIYDTIWDHAEPWLRLAMDQSLVTLLRREDIVSLKFSDGRNGFLWVVPQKTEGTSLVKLKIKIGEQLATLLSQARDSVVSPYLVHRLPDRARPSDKRASARLHHTQAMPEQLTRAFQDAREAAGVAGETRQASMKSEAWAAPCSAMQDGLQRRYKP